ncbi:2-nitropropane dioxygenase [Cryobacterium sp. TMT2-15-1]|uniref:DUF561 domain-containing protein n=1 Tax=Cryobacterium sp. TMT2-15-1 TaxID=1259246 RepID=UPI00106B844F|nr:DUF561 domain-containing protein [Cryobacterium sp. TMT2-15-1]TFC64026.1 2-nitropropane dioxygenase [Cryobacterium sp. TMT2-15-1]
MTQKLTQLLGVQAPIVLGAFGGLSSIQLTSLVSDRGGLGSYGLYGYSGERIFSTIQELRHLTASPFAVNLWLPLPGEPSPADSHAEFSAALDALKPLFVELDIEPPQRPDRYLPSFSEQIDAVLTARPAVVSFVYGVPPAEIVDAAHRYGIVILGTATTVDEAIALERGGVDAVIASGAEAAGHRVSFIDAAEDSLVGTFALVPQVVDAVIVPVIAAGGIADRRGVAAAHALGAAGVQVGTAFLCARQSAATEAHRLAITSTPAHGTVLTRSMSGRLARGIPNRAIRTIDSDTTHIAPFPVQNWLTGQFRTAASRRNIGDLVSLWAGQAGPLATWDDADDVFTELLHGLPPRG